MKKRPFWRRKYIIDDMQYRLLATNLAYFVVGVAIVGAVIFVPLLGEVRDATLPDAQRAIAAGELLALHSRFWPGLVLAIVLLSMHSVVMSHRIAGPLYRFRQVLSDIERGHVDQTISLRKHDFLMDEAEALNNVLAALRARDGELRLEAERLRGEMEVLGKTVGAEAGAGLQRVHDALDALDELLAEAVR